ncbi:hypothetical protein GOP47_0026662 [Adiantum capillus-veneris]|nr:hypothetical protein GOP47_0026662 [Adiantum capillus-veneris]
MAASAALSYVTSPQHHRVQKGFLQHVDVYIHGGKKSSIRYHQQNAHSGSTFKCRSMHAESADANDSSGRWASEKEAWSALKNQVEAFCGEFPHGAAATGLQVLVDKLEVAADPTNLQMQILLGQAKRFLRCPRASLVHYLNLVRNAESSGHPQLGAWYLETGLACREAGDLEGALHFCSKALGASIEGFGPSSLRVAQARSALSKVYFNLARYQDSISQGEVARPILKESGGPEEVVSLELTMADTLFHLKRYDEVVSILENAINSTSGLVHVNANITTARAYDAMRKNAGAKAHCQKAFDALELLEASAQTAAHYVMLASVYEVQQDFEQTVRLLAKSLRMYEKFPQNSPRNFITELEGKLGRLLLQLRKAEEALPYFERQLSKKRIAAGPLSEEKSGEAQELLHAHYYLGAAYSQCEKFHKALEQFEACVVLLSDICKGENPSFAMTVYNNAASMHYHLNRLDKAIECQRAAVDVLKKNKLQETNATKRVEALLEEYLQKANSF